MITFRDMTFCISPGCTNECGRKLTAELRNEAKRAGLMISCGWFCGGQPVVRPATPETDVEIEEEDKEGRDCSSAASHEANQRRKGVS